MPGCILHLTGHAFDPHVVDLGTLRPYAAYRAGERASPASPRVYDRGGLKFVVSERSGSDVAGQVQDAVAFLEEHQPSLAAVASRADVEDAYLDFGVHCRHPEALVQVDVFPALLLRLAGEVDLDLMVSTYPPPAEPA